MNKQQGFTLIELMVVIGIIAILSAIGIPAYQNYLRKAALTDMLQTFMPYRTAIELCALDHGGLSGCSSGTNGIPAPATSRYVKSMGITNGTVEMEGKDSLSDLNIVMSAQWDNANGITGWQRTCTIKSDGALKQACEDVFRFNAP